MIKKAFQSERFAICISHSAFHHISIWKACFAQSQSLENLSAFIFLLALTRASAWAGVSTSTVKWAAINPYQWKHYAIDLLIRKYNYSKWFCIYVAKRWKFVTISLVLIGCLIFQLFAEGFSCPKNIFSPFPATSKYTITFLGLRLNKELEHW